MGDPVQKNRPSNQDMRALDLFWFRYLLKTGRALATTLVSAAQEILPAFLPNTRLIKESIRGELGKIEKSGFFVRTGVGKHGAYYLELSKAAREMSAMPDEDVMDVMRTASLRRAKAYKVEKSEDFGAHRCLCGGLLNWIVNGRARLIPAFHVYENAHRFWPADAPALTDEAIVAVVDLGAKYGLYRSTVTLKYLRKQPSMADQRTATRPVHNQHIVTTETPFYVRWRKSADITADEFERLHSVIHAELFNNKLLLVYGSKKVETLDAGVRRVNLQQPEALSAQFDRVIKGKR